jgi:hypothetical protein
MLNKIKALLKRGKKESWGAEQVKAMAKLGGRLVL